MNLRIMASFAMCTWVPVAGRTEGAGLLDQLAVLVEDDGIDR